MRALSQDIRSSPRGRGPCLSQRPPQPNPPGQPPWAGQGQQPPVQPSVTVFAMSDTVSDSTQIAGSTREQLKSAAARLFREQGFHGTSVAQIAAASWITKSSLYHHFASKQALLAEILTDTASRVTPAVEAIASSQLPASERLRAAARCHVVELIHDQDKVACFVEEGRFLESEYRDAFVAARDKYEQFFRQILQDGVASGEFRPVSVRLASLAVLGMCNSVVHWYQPDGHLDVDTVAEEFADLAVKSLLSPPASYPAGSPRASQGTPGALPFGGEPDARSSRIPQTAQELSI
jgi:AcrR family transcriptional regulator